MRDVRSLIVIGISLAFGSAVGGVAQAAVYQCVPTTPGQPVLSSSAAGTCASGTKVTLPSSAADQQTLIDLLPYVSVVPTGVGAKPTIRVTGANLQIVSGSGSTTGAVNGKGNLVIGYDESPGTHAGSHNVMLGTNQAFSSYGAILGGSHNAATAPFSAVLGFDNTASGSRATVTGGYQNTASSAYSAVSGGRQNATSASYSTNQRWLQQ